MAISFLQTPDSISSGFNELNFVVSSTASHNTGFRFNTNIRDASGNTIASFINLKQPTYGNLLFDAHRTVENYLSYDIINLINQTTGWNRGINVFKKFYINVMEEYPKLSYHASGDSTSIIAVNSAMDYQDWVNNGLGGRFATSATRKWMTNQPTRVQVRTGDSYELGAIVNAADIISYLKIETYGLNGSLVQTATINNPYVGVSDDSHRFPAILVGPDDLNATTLTTGSQPLITTSIKYYRVATFNALNVQSLEWKEFEVDQSCLRDDYVRLHFLNQMGRFDGFNFTMVTDDNIEVTRAQYERLLGTLTASTFTHNTYGRGKSTFHSKVVQKYKLRSGYIDTDTAEWLKELIASPLVYMIVNINTGPTFVTITIDDVAYQSKKTIQDKLFNIELSITLSVNSQRQRL